MTPTVAIDARDAFAPSLRGWGRYARELVEALAAARSEFRILLYLDAEPEGVPEGCDVRVFGGLTRSAEILWEQALVPRALRRDRPDLYHGPAWFAPLRRPCPAVVTVHDLAFEVHPEDFARVTGWKYRTVGRRSARAADAVIVPTEFTRRDVIERWRVEPERVHVVPEAAALDGGAQAEGAQAGGAPAERPYVLAVGDLRKKKNLIRLVDAVAELRRRGHDVGLVLAGLDTGEGGAVLERASQAGAGEAVTLAGYVSDAELDRLYRDAVVLCHPSLWEGFGLVVLEAMARGCPVACAGATSLPEVGGDAALYFDPHSTDDMAGTLERLVADPGLRERLAAAGRRRAAEFTWAATAERTLAVYRSVLAE